MGKAATGCIVIRPNTSAIVLFALYSPKYKYNENPNDDIPPATSGTMKFKTFPDGSQNEIKHINNVMSLYPMKKAANGARK